MNLMANFVQKTEFLAKVRACPTGDRRDNGG